MLLTLTQHNVDSGHESDYETAVDMSHHAWAVEELCLSTPSGAGLRIRLEESVTTFTYLEPDFERLEHTGELVYETHASDQPPRMREECRAQAVLPTGCQVLSVQGWAELLEREGVAAWQALWDLDDLRWALDVEQDFAARPPFDPAELGDRVSRLRLRVGQSVPVQDFASAFGPDFALWWEELDQAGWRAVNERMRQRIESHCNLALLGLAQQIRDRI